MSAVQPPVTDLTLSQPIKDAVNSALMRGRPIAVAYVSEDGKPELSFRGSVQAYSDNQLALWARNPEGGIVKAMATNPNLSLLYADLNPDSRAFLTFRGRGRIDSSEAGRRTVYDNAPEPERNLDKERKGVALIIDLDRLDGLFAGSRLQMQRG